MLPVVQLYNSDNKMVMKENITKTSILQVNNNFSIFFSDGIMFIRDHSPALSNAQYLLIRNWFYRDPTLRSDCYLFKRIL